MDIQIKIRSLKDHQAHTARNSQLTQVWDYRRVLQLYPTWPRCCLGLNRPDNDQFRAYCRNPIKESDVSEADALLATMASCSPEEVLTSGRLGVLARLLLCKRWHRQEGRSEIERVVAEWTALIREYYIPPRAWVCRQPHTTNRLLPNTSALNLAMARIPLQMAPHTTPGLGIQRRDASHTTHPDLAPASGNHKDTSRAETDAGLASPVAKSTHDAKLQRQQDASSHTTRSTPSHPWCSNADKEETRGPISMSPTRILAWRADVPLFLPNIKNGQAKEIASPQEPKKPASAGTDTVGFASSGTAIVAGTSIDSSPETGTDAVQQRPPGGIEARAQAEGSVESDAIGMAFLGVVLFFGLLALLCCFVY